ncbi:MAG: putative lipid II flippase FtsW [Spirochaetia bacterium]|nr:putative lipid II flippase FtsW [Spirochaetia bacterium]
MDFFSWKNALKKSHINYFYFALILFLLGIGLNIILASSSFLARQQYGDPFFFFRKQAVYALISVIFFIAIVQVPYRIWKTAAWPLYFLSIATLFIVLFPPLGKKVGGAFRWLQFGFITVQPSDIAKFSVILLLSRIFANSEDSDAAKTATALIIIFLPVALIAIEPDYGTALHLVFASFFLLLLTGFPVYVMGVIFVTLLPAAYISVSKVAYIWERLVAYIDPYKYRFERAYQLIASYRSFLAGGMWGQGLGEGTRRHNLQARHTDFILAIIAEDLGFVGIVFILCLYFFIAVYGLHKMSRIEDKFGRLFGSGILLLFITQAIMNIAVTTGLMPTTGINIPLLSFGGTSLLTYMCSMGIILSIMRENP